MTTLKKTVADCRNIKCICLFPVLLILIERPVTCKLQVAKC